MEKQHRLELKLGFQIDFSVYGIVACAEVEVLLGCHHQSAS